MTVGSGREVEEEVRKWTVGSDGVRVLFSQCELRFCSTGIHWGALGPDGQWGSQIASNANAFG